ncbi:putative gpi anchored dioxygenase [Phaeomoniella chlamydospora]|uniref:Putative gpi anchored dioxygenase n=1 Tax=Phaeomoniella chlamydospora TaxID=158046 RepID=A0A0G2FRM5_PHACM|nr:putative gpi anchored dioxygenase [Phaeomoniella chlamydospora]
MQLISLGKVAVIALATLASAHPGEHEEHNHEAELAKRHFQANARRSLKACSNRLESCDLNARAVARRAATVQKYSKRPVVRDTDTVLNTSHHSDLAVTPSTSESVLFSSNFTCVLNPEGETGPYYVKGEHIRSNLRESQPGVPVVIDGQFVDVETCEPIADLWWDVWNCNSTGVYSGLVATGNGNTNDESNLNATFLRGVQKSDSEGVVQFETMFPGHYSGRTTHIHMVAHLNVTVLPNNTVVGGTVAHIGQLFWDQDLIYEVEGTYPYNTNNITITTNAEDRVFSTETEDTTSDPVLEYVYLGDDLSHGLFAWVTIGVNRSATYSPNYNFIYTSSGGEAIDEVGTDTVN